MFCRNTFTCIVTGVVNNIHMLCKVMLQECRVVAQMACQLFQLFENNFELFVSLLCHILNIVNCFDVLPEIAFPPSFETAFFAGKVLYFFMNDPDVFFQRFSTNKFEIALLTHQVICLVMNISDVFLQSHSKSRSVVTLLTLPVCYLIMSSFNVLHQTNIPCSIEVALFTSKAFHFMICSNLVFY